MTNVGRVIENGLSPIDALRAFTIWPATILGVENQLGSIETGKIANLTVTRGDLFDRNSRVVHVFIDGRPVDLRPVSDRPSGRNPLTGTWNLTVNLGQTERTGSITLEQQGERLEGTIAGTLGTGQISNASTSSSGEVRFTVPLEVEGQTKEATFVGTVSGDQIRGTVTVVGAAPGSFTATRANLRLPPGAIQAP
jgi:adenine deaminase